MINEKMYKILLKIDGVRERADIGLDKINKFMRTTNGQKSK